MKTWHTSKLFAFSTVLATMAVAGAACHAKPTVAPSATAPAPAATVPARPPAPATAPPAPRAAATPAPLSEAEMFARKSLADLNAEHPLSDAFFAYDQNMIQSDAQKALQQDAAWLAKWPQTQVRIEGYCDERGSAEYNLGLGERRATAVQQYLENLGVAESRIHIVSLGKESAFCQGDGENCWSQNRRGHFVITGK